MKLVSISLGSWLVGLAAILLTFYVVEGANLSAADVKGATVMSLIVAALLFSSPMLPRSSGCGAASVVVVPLPSFHSHQRSCSIFLSF